MWGGKPVRASGPGGPPSRRFRAVRARSGPCRDTGPFAPAGGRRARWSGGARAGGGFGGGPGGAPRVSFGRRAASVFARGRRGSQGGLDGAVCPGRRPAPTSKPGYPDASALARQPRARGAPLRAAGPRAPVSFRARLGLGCGDGSPGRCPRIRRIGRRRTRPWPAAGARSGLLEGSRSGPRCAGRAAAR